MEVLVPWLRQRMEREARCKVQGWVAVDTVLMVSEFRDLRFIGFRV